MKVALIISSVHLLATFSIAQNNSNDAQTLVQAERDFCNISKSKTTKQAFMAVLAEDAILFRPQPVNGKNWMNENPESPGLLIWEPAWAETSQAGDIGYTTGPYEFRANRTDTVAANFGHYVSIWKKQPDQPWQLVMDVGIGHTKLEKVSTLTFPPKENIKPQQVSQAQKELLKADQKFAQILKENGIAKAYAANMAMQARLYRNGHFPFIGNSSVEKYLITLKGTLVSETVEGFVAREGDMGYTYGITTYQEEKAEKQYSNYIRIWKRQADNTWKIVLDIQTPRPAPK
ncbi:nuclear transport factor 2 family protein [Rhodocytophaga rosea]|uniref:Nuclear transport factor 2 family protein n=1 Tax=Rhodocytophaga rosea TaxID=2704465 RepID=A0A6C0GDL4_9BACT|nr:nuclear transport factor 2 family protein [Rhodocytophaga rosea]QHT66051.1 nuclear transport factor 2 family protein [Rhodocytophaga rosea]